MEDISFTYTAVGTHEEQKNWEWREKEGKIMK